jgi:hypothetical protein
MDELERLHKKLISILKENIPPLKVKSESEASIELTGTKEAMQGKKKVDGFYFATIMPKPKDTRLYFFPIYTHVTEFENISPDLRKYLKGKSCFHIKKMDTELENEIRQMVKKGVKLYQKDGLI